MNSSEKIPRPKVSTSERYSADDVIRVNDQWYIAASSHRANASPQVLKEGDTFAVFDRLGEIGATGLGEQGVYHMGTRHLSQWEVFVSHRRPMLLNSTVKEDNSMLVLQMTTSDVVQDDGFVLPHGTLDVFRSLSLEDGNFQERLRLTNYSRVPLELLVEFRFDSDFKDVFEVRGVKRDQRGKMKEPQVLERSVVIAYRGLDHQDRSTSIQFDGDCRFESIDDRRCLMLVRLDVGGQKTIKSIIQCHSRASCFATTKQISQSQASARQFGHQAQSEDVFEPTRVFTSNEQFNGWINRSLADLRMLATDTLYGRYPYAGVPWFATPFGRDGLITASQTVWMYPRLARGVLDFLAATQAREVNEATESEPGKIVHEMREGEMAALNEVPFRSYYGTVDATPLFIILAGQYFRRTGDRGFIDFIWNNIERAVKWIDEFGDRDGDGFVEYQSHNERGLVHQCWKDSNDSIFHADGSDALGPIAVSEVQGYVYEAKLYAAEMAEMRGDFGLSEQLRTESAELRSKFNRQFWSDSIETFAMALDGEKRRCEVHSSNSGHLLHHGIVEASHALDVARTLTDERSFNGWGIRTIAKGEVRYNPMAYHNGSIWPHDTAISAAGLARYGFRKEAMAVMTGLFEASLYNELHRMPELFCGFDRLTGQGPTFWPVACSPQAWAAGAVFLLLQATLGLSFFPSKPQVRFNKPSLPEYLKWVRIQNLNVGDARVDLVLRRHPHDVGLNVERKEGNIEIVVIG